MLAYSLESKKFKLSTKDVKIYFIGTEKNFPTFDGLNPVAIWAARCLLHLGFEI